MNGVYVDPDDLRKSCDDVNELAHFSTTGDGYDGDMAKPARTDANFTSDLAGFDFGAALEKANTNWQKKCDNLGEALGEYRDNLYYYCLSLEGTDDMNAHGINEAAKPEWIDDVPSEFENENGVYHHG